MFDIDFFKNSFKIKKKITSKQLSSFDFKEVENELEFLRKILMGYRFLLKKGNTI
jgi:hypothetical protein